MTLDEAVQKLRDSRGAIGPEMTPEQHAEAAFDVDRALAALRSWAYGGSLVDVVSLTTGEKIRTYAAGRRLQDVAHMVWDHRVAGKQRVNVTTANGLKGGFELTSREEVYSAPSRWLDVDDAQAPDGTRTVYGAPFGAEGSE